MFSALSSSIQGTLQRFHRMMEHALDEALDAADEALRPPQGRGGDDASSSSSAAATASASTAGHQNPNPARAADFTPLVGDVHAVKRALMRPPCSLPIELVISILDYAEYWPVLARAERHDRVRYTAATTPGNSVADLYLASPPLPVPEGEDGELVRATPREVRFCIRSRDQGWVSQDRRGLGMLIFLYCFFLFALLLLRRRYAAIGCRSVRESAGSLSTRPTLSFLLLHHDIPLPLMRVQNSTACLIHLSLPLSRSIRAFLLMVRRLNHSPDQFHRTIDSNTTRLATS